MNAPRTVLTLLAFCALIAVTPCGAEDYASPKDEIAAAVTWYDSLQWPDVLGKPYVEVTLTDSKSELRWRPRRTMRGFLLSEDDKAYHVFCDGATQCILKSPLPGLADLPAEARELGPTSAVENEIKELRHTQSDDRGFHTPYFPSGWLRTYPHLFVLARCFARQGRTDLAEKLDKELTIRLVQIPVKSISQEPNFAIAIKKWIGNAAMLEAINGFGDVSLTRPQLLRQFERLARDFSGGGSNEETASFVERLRTMIAEDEAHTKPARPIEVMSDDEKARELIFRLRDEDGLQKSYSLVANWLETTAFIRGPLRPGSLLTRTPVEPFGPDDSPAHQLIRLGPAAVPALIATLDDERLSRCVERGQQSAEMRRDPWNAVLTVGDCAETILFYISGRHFGKAFGDRGSLPKGGQVASTRAQAEQWWRERQEKGEKQMLIQGVRLADRDSLEQARHLAVLDPSAAVQALAAGIETSKSLEGRIALIREIATIPGEAATRTLYELMKSGIHLGDRVSAAAGLWQRGETSVAATVIREWEKWKPSTLPYVPNDEDTETLELIDFLASCGDNAALHALDTRFSSLPVETKFLVIESGSNSNFDRTEVESKPLPAEFEALRENLIVKALDDKVQRFRYSGGRNGVSLTNPRVCDMAACALAELQPARYAFKGGVTRFERDVQIAQMRNSWRSTHGLAPLPLPKSASHDAVGAEEDRNAVVSCEWSGGPPLSTLPIAVGQTLTGGDFVKTVLYLHHHLPKDCIGFTLSSERDRNQSGIMVEIEWLHGPPPEPSSQEDCSGSLWLDEQSTLGFFPREGPKDSADPNDAARQGEEVSAVLRRSVANPLSIVCSWKWARVLHAPPH